MAKAVKIIVLLLIVAFSVTLKLKDYQSFKDPDAFLVTADAYRYARYAIEIQNNTYGKIDYLADVPDFGINDYPPPLLSLMAAWLSDASGIQIHYYFLILPPLLSVFFVIPFYFWLKPFGNDYVTFGAITMGLFNFFYYVRTRAGYFDTDCLMLFFVFTVILFITKAVCEKDNQFKSYFFLLLAGLSMALFRWWYAHYFFTLVFLFSLLIGLIAWRHNFKNICLKLLFFIALSNPVELFYYIFTSPFLKDYFYGNIMNIERFKMPINAYASIGELIPLNIWQTITFTTDNRLSFAVAVVFGVVFYFKNTRYVSVSLPILCIGLFSFYGGNRYLMYLGPFIGIGFGYAMYIMVGYLLRSLSDKKQRIFYIAGLLLLISLLVPPSIVKFKTKPLFIDKTAGDLLRLNTLTEKNAYIWSWWGIGNQVQYYSQRALYMDNSYFDPLKLYIMLKAFTAQDENTYYKSIAFLTNKRKSEYEELKKDLPQLMKSVDDYKIAPSQPVYVLLYNGMLERFILKDNALPKDEADLLNKRLPISNSSCIKIDNDAMKCNGFVFYNKNREVKISDKRIQMKYKKIIYYNKQYATKKQFQLNINGENNIYLIYAKNGSMHEIIAHEDFEKTMLFKMMIESKNNFRHFELVYEDYPYMVLYRVR